MANLAQARRRLTWTIIAFGVLDIVAAAILISPVVGSPATQQEQVKKLQTDIQEKENVRKVIPPERMRSHLTEASRQIDAFYQERFPAEYSVILETLDKLARENHVSIGQAKYPSEESTVPGLKRVTIEATLVGNYLQEVKFINALERNPLVFLIDSVRLGEQTEGNVRLQLKLETYLKVSG